MDSFQDFYINLPIGYQTFVDYLGIKLHFNNFYFIWNKNKEYIKNKTKLFEKRNDKKFFENFEKSHRKRNDRIEYLISGFIFNPDFWIGNIFKEDFINFHNDRINRLDNLETIFKNDCEKIEFEMNDMKISFEKIFLTSGTKSPIITQIPGINLESLSILQHLTGWANTWVPISSINEKTRRMIIHKYTYFLNITKNIQKTFKKLIQS